MKRRKKLRVGVIMGGRSGEHEVSLASAYSVIKALDRSKYDIVPVKITKKGRWLISYDLKKILAEPEKGFLKKILMPEPENQSLVPFNSQNNRTKIPLDVIFPVLHGTYGEDGKIQGLFELANLPYVGSGVLGSAVGMDKIIMKQLFIQAGLKTVKFIYFTKKEWFEDNQSVIRRIDRFLKFPVFVKPANLGSSVGISKASTANTLKAAINTACQYDRRILVEQGVINGREIECAVLGNENPKASVSGEIIPGDDFYSFKDKYVSNKYKIVIPAKIKPSQARNIQRFSIKAFQLLDLAGLARVDFFLDKAGQILINEVNTMPGFTSISMYPKLWEACGISYSDLLDKLIKLALEKHRKKNKLITDFRQKLEV